MSYDPAWPADHAHAAAAKFREQFTGLKSLIDAVPGGAQGPKGDKGDPGSVGGQGPAGADGRGLNVRGDWDGALTYNRGDLVAYGGQLYVCFADGLSGSSPDPDIINWRLLSITGPRGSDGGSGPFNDPVFFNNTVFLGLQMLKFDTLRDSGSGEAAAVLSASDDGCGPLLRLVCRRSGADQCAPRLDFGGVTDGMGAPTAQDGDLMSWRAGDQTVHPIRNDTARNPVSLPDLSLEFSDPPTKAECEALRDYVISLVSNIRR